MPTKYHWTIELKNSSGVAMRLCCVASTREIAEAWAKKQAGLPDTAMVRGTFMQEEPVTILD